MPKFGAVSSALIRATPGMPLSADYYLGDTAVTDRDIAMLEKRIKNSQAQLRSAKKRKAEGEARAADLERRGLLVRLDKEETCRKPKRKRGASKAPTGSGAS